MSTQVNGMGLVIGFDLGRLRQSLEAREKLKQRAAEAADTEVKPSKDFSPGRLVNTLSDKGRILNVVA